MFDAPSLAPPPGMRPRAAAKRLTEGDECFKSPMEKSSSAHGPSGEVSSIGCGCHFSALMEKPRPAHRLRLHLENCRRRVFSDSALSCGRRVQGTPDETLTRPLRRSSTYQAPSSSRLDQETAPSQRRHQIKLTQKLAPWSRQHHETKAERPFIKEPFRVKARVSDSTAASFRRHVVLKRLTN